MFELSCKCFDWKLIFLKVFSPKKIHWTPGRPVNGLNRGRFGDWSLKMRVQAQFVLPLSIFGVSHPLRFLLMSFKRSNNFCKTILGLKESCQAPLNNILAVKPTKPKKPEMFWAISRLVYHWKIIEPWSLWQFLERLKSHKAI